MCFSTRNLTSIFAGLALCLGVSISSANLGNSDEDSAIDDADFQVGKAAIETQNWAKAIEVLAKTAEMYPDSADTHNYLGYAYRKSGDLDTALKHYERALEIDPTHKPAHEYLGEAYLMKNDLDGATRQLGKLAKLCSPIPCEEFKELKRAVDEFKRK